MIATLFSSFILLTAPTTPVDPLIEIIRQHHLETSEGRFSFLAEKLGPYAEAADRLNQEIAALSEQIQNLSPEQNQAEILSLSEEVAKRMDLVSQMLPSLGMALHLNSDLEQIESILNSGEPLTPGEREVVNRIAALCCAIDQYKQE